MIFQDFWLSDISVESPRCKMLVFDVDNMVIAGRQPLSGAENFLQNIRSSHTSIRFLTNGSNHSRIEKNADATYLQVTACPPQSIFMR